MLKLARLQSLLQVVVVIAIFLPGCQTLPSNQAESGKEASVTAPTLVAYSQLPADTFASGPASGNNNGKGEPISANDRQGPFPGQPVQGFSGVQRNPNSPETLLFLSDNGFGSKKNSADYRLRIYEIKPHFNSAQAAEVVGFVELSDPNRHVPFTLVNANSTERALTGADFDVESFAIDNRGDYWIGDEFGPYMLHFNNQGVLLEPPIATPQVVNGKLDRQNFVVSPDNPELQGSENLGRSKGFEGMAISPDRKTLYPLLEGGVAGDPKNRLRIYQFSTESSQYEKFIGFYPTINRNPIGDFVAINDTQFLVIERDHFEGAKAQFKKVFWLDISQQDADGTVKKEELVDLLNIADPHDLNNDGYTQFDFPYVTIEDILIVDAHTLLIANDNNYPFSRGRADDIDRTEIIKIKLPSPLAVE